MQVTGMTAQFNLIVIRAADLAQALSFYKLLGLQFSEERHGTRPLHYACPMNGIVLEIYPATSARPAETSTRLGFAVADIGSAVELLRAAGAKVVSAPSPSAWGIRAVVADPDGRHVELSQPVETD